jgi:hypothetical protein
MILTLHSNDQVLHINITTNQFMRLRDENISSTEVEQIAKACEINVSVLIDYIQSIKKSSNDTYELDASCDYSDHL